MSELIIETIGGNCPVQAEGFIAGKPFYFRARGEHWSLGIGGEPVCNPEWEASEDWGDEPYAAGWMTVDEAKRIISEQAAIYLKSIRPWWKFWS